MNFAAKNLFVFIACLLCIASMERLAAAEDVTKLKRQGKLTLDDDFDRAELGDAWKVNDGRARKAGDLKSQVQLAGGVLQIRRSEKSNHGASARTTVVFADAVIEVRFRLTGEDGAFAVNLNNTEWGKQQTPKRFGHLGRVQVGAEHVLIEDQKTPKLTAEFVKLKEGGAGKDELAAWKKKNTRARFSADVSAGQWHDLAIVVQGEQVRVFLDNQPAGEYEANGFAHPGKTSLAFAVPEAVDIDRLKVWKLR